MGDLGLLDASKLSALYVKGSGILQLRGEFTSVHPVKDARFVQVEVLGSLSFDVSGVEAKSTVQRYSGKIADLDVKITLPNKTYSGTTVVFATKTNDSVKTAIQYIDANDEEFVGRRPPEESLFLNWVGTASQAVKAKYPDSVLMNIEATKTLGAKNWVTLSYSASFRVSKSKMVVVTGNGTNISDPTDAMEVFADITNPSQAKLNPWDIVYNSGIPNIKDYTYFNFIQYKASKSGLPDQPYYDFRASATKRIALVGASDGKKYDM